jgi:hypothetical protein
MESQQRNVIDAGEELFARAHDLAQHIEHQVCRLAGAHGLPGPHGPGEAAEPGGDAEPYPSPPHEGSPS